MKTAVCEASRLWERLPRDRPLRQGPGCGLWSQTTRFRSWVGTNLGLPEPVMAPFLPWKTAIVIKAASQSRCEGLNEMIYGGGLGQVLRH